MLSLKKFIEIKINSTNKTTLYHNHNNLIYKKNYTNEKKN